MNQPDKVTIPDDAKVVLTATNQTPQYRTIRVLVDGKVHPRLTAFKTVREAAQAVFQANQNVKLHFDDRSWLEIDSVGIPRYRDSAYYRPQLEVPVEFIELIDDATMAVMIEGKKQLFAQYQRENPYGDNDLVESVREVIMRILALPETKEKEIVLGKIVEAQNTIVDAQTNHGSITAMKDGQAGQDVGNLVFYTNGQDKTPKPSVQDLFDAGIAQELPFAVARKVLDPTDPFPPLNWKTSVVDLMKVLEMDSSLEARRKLAVEMGYSSTLLEDTATMNEWLHAVLMEKHSKVHKLPPLRPIAKILRTKIPVVPNLPVQPPEELALFQDGHAADGRTPSEIILDEHFAQWYRDHGLTPQVFDKAVVRFLEWQRTEVRKPIVQLDRALYSVDVNLEQVYPDPTHPEYDGPAVTHKAGPPLKMYVVYEDNYDSQGDIQERLRSFETEVLQDALDFHFANQDKYSGIQVEREGEETNDRVDIEGWRRFNKGYISDKWPQYVLYENITCVGSDEVDHRKELHRTTSPHMAMSLMSVNGKVDGIFAEYRDGRQVDIEPKPKPIHEWIMMTSENAPKAITTLTAQGLYIETVLPDQKYSLSESDPWRWFVEEKDVEEPIVTESSLANAVIKFFEAKEIDEPEAAIVIHMNLNLLVWLMKDAEDSKIKLHAGFRPTTFESNDEFQKFVFDLPWVKKFREYFTYA